MSGGGGHNGDKGVNYLTLGGKGGGGASVVHRKHEFYMWVLKN